MPGPGYSNVGVACFRQAEIIRACVRLLMQIQTRFHTLDAKLRPPTVALAKRYLSPTDSENPPDQLLSFILIGERYVGCMKGSHKPSFAQNGMRLVSGAHSRPRCHGKNSDSSQRIFIRC